MKARVIVAVIVVGVLMGAGARETSGAKAKKKPPVAAAKCDKVYARSFTVTRGVGKVQMRVLKLTPKQSPATPPMGQPVFEEATRLCRDLGPGWRVAVGSFGAAVLT